MGSLARLLGAAVMVPALVDIAQASRDLATCPTLVPSAPVALTERNAMRCQRTVAAASTRVVASTLEAVHACMARVQSGELAGDAAGLCVPHHRLSNGEYVAPGDALTADRVATALEALATDVVRGCTNGGFLAAAECGPDPASRVGCIVRDHLEHVAHVVDATHGMPAAPVDAEAERCQTAISRASRAFLVRALRAHVSCLARRRHSPPVPPARACLGEVASGGFLLPNDRKTAARFRAAETKLTSRLARCSAAALAALDACGRDQATLRACLRCSLGREALLLVQGHRDTVADRGTTTFVDWAALRNPIYSRDDRSIKDQALVFREGSFHLFASQRFESTVSNPPPPLVFRSSDLRTWEELPWPWTETAEGPIEAAGSPNLIEIAGIWYATFQAHPPLNADEAAREIFLSTSADLTTWSPVASFTRGLVVNPIIDGALARAGDTFFLVFKDRVQQLTYVTGSTTAALDGSWQPPVRAYPGSADPVLGFAENYQLIEIDGRRHVVATARDPEPVRCVAPIYDIYTCDHEPYLYAVPEAGAVLAGWSQWTRRRQLRVPYEAWNHFMHANTGFLSDWRAHDGFFYLSYAGSDDGDSFDLRGHGRIGLARSRDLVHWRLPGDLRD